MNSTLLSWLAPLTATIAIPFVGWMFNRIASARSLETRTTITNAIDDLDGRLRRHFDERIDEVKDTVEALSTREALTRDRVARVEGRLDEHLRRNGG